MAISYVTNALGSTSSTTTFSITLPATQAGDLLILELAHRATADPTIGGTGITTGGLTWTKRHSQLFGSSTFSGKTYTAIAQGDHSGQTVTGSGLTNSCAAIVTVYRGADTSDPLGAATIVGEENASGNETQAQITTTAANAYVVLVVVNSPDYAISSQSCTTPGALTERAERLSTGGTDTSVAHASAEKEAAGATGAFTWAQTNAASGSWAYAINPAAVIHAFTAAPIATAAPTVGTPILGQVHQFTANGIQAAAPTVGTPTLEDHEPPVVFSTNGITTAAPTIGAPVFGQIHTFAAQNVGTAAPTVGTPAIGQKHIFAAVGVASGVPSVSAPAVGQVHAFVALGVKTGSPVVGSPALSIVVNLTAQGVATGAPTIETPPLTEQAPPVVFSANAIQTGTPTIGTPAIGQKHSFAVIGVTTSAPTAGTPNIGQIHAFAAQAVNTGTPGFSTILFGQIHHFTGLGVQTGQPEVGLPGGYEPGLKESFTGTSRMQRAIARDSQRGTSAVGGASSTRTQHTGTSRITRSHE